MEETVLDLSVIDFRRHRLERVKQFYSSLTLVTFHSHLGHLSEISESVASYGATITIEKCFQKEFKSSLRGAAKNPSRKYGGYFMGGLYQKFVANLLERFSLFVSRKALSYRTCFRNR